MDRSPPRHPLGNGDDWQRNLVTVRAEERVLPVVVRGELVSKLTLT
jgi:hypothetical protein